MALELDFEGAGGGQVAPGESPASAPTPAAANRPSPSPSTPASTPPTPANGQQTPVSQPDSAAPSASEQQLQNQILQSLRGRRTDLEIPDDMTDDEFLDGVLSVLDRSSDLPSEEELQQFRQFQANQAQWVAQQAMNQGKNPGNAGNQAPNSPQPAVKQPEEKPKTRPEWLQKLEPIKFERPTMDPMAEIAAQNGLVRFDQSTGAYSPVKGQEANAMVVAAANELTKHYLAEQKYLKQFRENPVEFTQRATAPLLEQLLDYIDEKFSGTEKEFGDFRQKIEQESAEEHFAKNVDRYYVLDDKGNPKFDLKTGRRVFTPEGQAYAQAIGMLEQSGVTGHQAHLEALKKVDEWKQAARLFSPPAPAAPAALPAPAAPPATPVAQTPPVEQPPMPQPTPNQDSQQRSSQRFRSFIANAAKEAQANGNGAVPHNRLNHAVPDPQFQTAGGRQKSAPKLSAYVRQAQAANS